MPFPTTKPVRSTTTANGGELEYARESTKGRFQFEMAETISGPTTSSYKALTKKLPAGTRIDAIAIRCTSAGTISTGTHFGLGTGSGGDPDQFVEITFTSYDAANDFIVLLPDVATILTSETTVSLASLNGSGAASGDITAGTWDIIFYCTKFNLPLAV